MNPHASSRVRGEKGFTLLELIVVLAILGVLTAILIPQFADLFTQGDNASYDTDVSAVTTAVGQFRLARHDGPDGSNEWGAGQPNRRLYPTEDGLVGDIELDNATASADAYGTPLVVKYVEGVGIGTPADDADIQASLIWLGLLVNEPSDTGTSAQQQSTGEASPQAGEDGEYLQEFPQSAHADNTAMAAGGSFTNGTYYYVVLHNGDVKAVYKDGSNYYAGFNESYP